MYSRTARVSTVRWNLKEAVSESLVRRTEIAYKARLRVISWQRTAKSNNYHVCRSRVKRRSRQFTRKGNKIHTDRGRLVDTSWEMQTEFSTPDLKDGFQIDVYVDPNLIEVFVNDGEYIISNCVYNLGTDIHQQGNVKYEMYTLEGTDVSEA